jgi:NTP pyrophosphatase (non-canonical NTP hydrolase)
MTEKEEIEIAYKKAKEKLADETRSNARKAELAAENALTGEGVAKRRARDDAANQIALSAFHTVDSAHMKEEVQDLLILKYYLTKHLAVDMSKAREEFAQDAKAEYDRLYTKAFAEWKKRI